MICNLLVTSIARDINIDFKIYPSPSIIDYKLTPIDSDITINSNTPPSSPTLILTSPPFRWNGLSNDQVLPKKITIPSCDIPLLF